MLKYTSNADLKLELNHSKYAVKILKEKNWKLIK